MDLELRSVTSDVAVKDGDRRALSWSNRSGAGVEVITPEARIESSGLGRQSALRLGT